MQIPHTPYNDLVAQVAAAADKVFASPQGRKANSVELLAAISRLVPMIQAAIKQPGSEIGNAAYIQHLKTDTAAAQQIQQMQAERLRELNQFRLALDEPGAVQAYESAMAQGGHPAALASIDRAAADWLNAYQDPNAQNTAFDALRAAIASSGQRPPVELWWNLWDHNPATSEAVGNKWLVSLQSYSGIQAGPRLRELVQIRVKHLQLADKPLTIDGTLMSGAHFSTAAWKGKVILVVGWYQAGRLNLIPQFQGLLDKHHAQGLEVVGLAYDETFGGARTALAAHPECKFPVMYQATKLDPAYGCVPLGVFRFGEDAMGGSMVIDRNGIMHYIDDPLKLQSVEAQVVNLLADSQ